MDVNEHDRLSNITLGHKSKQRNMSQPIRGQGCNLGFQFMPKLKSINTSSEHIEEYCSGKEV
jgi:hypothetical protein